MYWIYAGVVVACCLPAAWLIKELNPPKTRQMVDLNLLRDARFILLAVGSAAAIFPLCHIPALHPVR
jgi:hypothetical protein